MTTEPTRDLLFATAASFNGHAEPGLAWDKPAGDGNRPGDDYNARAGWEEILGTAGWEAIIRRGDEIFWRRPGKSGRCWSATTGRCRSERGEPLLHVFTSNAAPFAPERTYSKFAAYTLLHHAGDYKAAARALAGQGYGEQRPPAPDRPPATARATTRPEPAVLEPEPWPAPPRPEAYLGIAGDLVRRIEPQTEADPVAVLGQILAMFGNVIGRTPYFRVEEDKHYGNLFVCLVGESSRGRKGTSKGRALRAFGKLHDEWVTRRIASGLSSGEGLIWAVRDEVRKREPVKQRGRVVSYQEVITDEGIDDKRLLIVESEFVLPLRAASREGNTLSARIREAWDTGRLNTLTKNSAARATNAHISIIGHITRAELTGNLDQVETANGFANRFLWLAARRSKMLPLGGEPVDLAPLDHKLALAVEQAGKVGEVGLDTAAREWWAEELYPRLTAGLSGIVGKVTSRAEAQVRRLALLYALLDFQPVVSIDHLGAAVALWDYAAASALWAFGASTGDSVADTILSALKDAAPEGLNSRDLFDLLGSRAGADRVGQALSLLKDAGLVRGDDYRPEGGRGGRPGKRWFFTGNFRQQTSKPPPAPPRRI